MIYVLMLNDMRSSNIEIVNPRAWSEDRDALVRFAEAEEVPPYNDGQWAKSFRKDGPLEWMNPPTIAGGILTLNGSVICGVPTSDPRPIQELVGVVKIG